MENHRGNGDDQELVRAWHKLREGKISRREFIAVVASVLGAGAAMSMLAACAPEQAPAPTKAPAATPAAATPGAGAATGVEMVDTTKWKKPGPWRIAHASQGPTNSWVVMYDAYIEYGVKDKFKDKFSELLYTDANGNADKQVNDVEDLLVKKPDLLILTALGPAALVGVVEKAWDKGIPVIYGSGRVNSDKYVTWVERSNFENGKMFAEWIAKKLNGKGSYIMLSGIAGVSVAEDRLKGGRETFKKYPEMKELGQAYCDWSPVKGKSATQAFIAAHPKIDAVWSDSGLMTMGAIEAFAEAGKPIPPLTGEDLNGFLRKCKEHNVDFYAVQYPPEIGIRAVELAVKILSGEPVPRYVNVPAKAFDRSELDKYFMPDYNDDLWTINEFPPEWIEKMGFKKKK